MSQENVELTRRWVEAYNARDMAALVDLTATDFEFLPYLATLVETTIYRGLDGLLKYFQDADAAWETIQARLDDVRAASGERTVSYGELHGKGRASGLEVRVPLAWVVNARDGKVARIETYVSWQEALAAVGLSE